ncbi:hypothetical protein [Thalassococcus sp. S3]|uniref:hypothetical protein n=1 Tax=Thalassococcus sp. S3 TaxID=2017482 RepID=UPI001024258F|nr:hypothetical protein [Thalassococcus sp. S3]QBF31870.1 hypothetical protein CFI11_11660 [Thalassococcus sp. S3]
MIIFLRAISTFGIFLFGSLLILLMQNPKILETSAVGFVQNQITKEVRERFPTLSADELSRGLSLLSDRLGERQDRILTQLEEQLPEYVGEIVGAYCGCKESGEAFAQNLRASMEGHAQRLGFAQGNLSDLIIGKYDRIVAALRQDLMIFLGVNLVAFLSVLGATFTPPNRRPLTVYPAGLLIVSVGISSYLYLFNTNWFYAILFQDYAGLAYAAGMLVIFAFLCDIVLNRARVSLRMLSHLPSAFVPAGC